MSRLPFVLPPDYVECIAELKREIAAAQRRAVLSINAEQIRLYHRIGTEILTRQERNGWGAKVIERAAVDLSDAFPGMKGFSTRNLKYMSVFARLCPDLRIGQQPAAQLPWFHVVTLLTKAPDANSRECSRCEAHGHRECMAKRSRSIRLPAVPFPIHAGSASRPRRVPTLCLSILRACPPTRAARSSSAQSAQSHQAVPMLERRSCRD